MKNYPTFTDAAKLNDLEKVHEDFNLLLYMLHYIDKDAFSRKEIREVAFAIKMALNTVEKMKSKANYK